MTEITHTKTESLDDDVAEKGPYFVPVDIRREFTYEEQRKIVRRIDWHGKSIS